MEPAIGLSTKVSFVTFRHVHHHRLSLVQTQKDLDGKLVAFQRFDRDLESVSV